MKQEFYRIVEQYKDRLYFVALKLVKNPNDAEDLVQETFLQAYKNLSGFRQQSSIYSWLYRILFNRCWHFRHDRKYKEYSLDKPDPDGPGYLTAELLSPEKDPSELSETETKRKLIEKSVNELKKKLREIIILREFNGFSYEELSITLNISRGTVMSRLNRARKKLQEKLVTLGLG